MILINSFFNNNFSKFVTQDKAAHSWFSRPRSLSKDGYTYIGTIANFGSGYKSGLIRINESNNSFVGIELSSVIEQDDHNEASIIYSSVSSKYIAAYCEHSTTPIIRWRLSGDGETWESEQTINTTVQGDSTYSALFEAANGDIYYLARIFTSGLVGGWYYFKSTDGGETFGSAVFFLDIFEGASYPIMNQDTIDKNIIHIAATEFPNSDFGGHIDNGLWYGYFDLSTDTYYDGQGGSTSSLPAGMRADSHKIDTLAKPDEFWIEDIGIDSSGYPRILYTKLLDYHNDSGVHKERWYTEWNGSTWSTPYNMGESQDTWSEVPNTGSNIQDNNFSDPPNIVTASTYSSVGRFNDRNVNQMFLHRMVSAGEKTELFRVTRLASNSFSWEQLTFNSDEHQWRANSISSGPYHVYWINARSYLDMKHFDQDIIIGKL